MLTAGEVTAAAARWSQADVHFMREALRLGAANPHATAPNPSVGCVIVRDGTVIGWGATLPPGQAHAERVALDGCSGSPAGATLYVTLEPCTFEGRTGACTTALQRAGIARVVYAVADPNPRMAARAHQVLGAAGIRVDGGLLADEAERLHADFLFRHRMGRPRVCAPLLRAPAPTPGGDAAAPPADDTGRLRAQASLQRAWACAGTLVTTADRVLSNPTGYTKPVIAGAARALHLVVLGDRDANARVGEALAARALIAVPLGGPVPDAADRRPAFTTIDLDLGTNGDVGTHGVDSRTLMDLLAGLDANTLALDGCANLLDTFAAHDLLDTWTVDLPQAAAGRIPGQAASWLDRVCADARRFVFTGGAAVGDTLRIEFSR